MKMEENLKKNGIRSHQLEEILRKKGIRRPSPPRLNISSTKLTQAELSSAAQNFIKLICRICLPNQHYFMRGFY
jgi:hypothetical protein